ncbi:hypothetical protein [Deinococcus sp. NW-56]|uniref:hypothetical protein n=1 Tax=Deinococcus sp. NW-56 TaxID=2080419 RepID=UPI001F2310C1|nr:hypothetical protein [Deinococcus sp. NW-56]
MPAHDLILPLAGGRLAPSQPLTPEACHALSLELRDLQHAFRLSRPQADAPGGEDHAHEAPRPVPLDPPPCAPDPAHVQQARTLLQGRRVLLIGGQPDPVREAALTDALGLAGLDWVATDAYHNGLAAGVRIRPDTALVILAVRWIPHAHNLIRQEARSRGVPFVMLPGGLSVSNVAWHVTGQVSRQLSA